MLYSCLSLFVILRFFFFFFFNDTATTEIYTLSLHDALPIYHECAPAAFRREVPRHDVSLRSRRPGGPDHQLRIRDGARGDRKSTRLNSSHSQISYAVFCLKKKKKSINIQLYS